MAHMRQAKKRIRQTERRTAVNRARKSRIRTLVRKVEDAIAAGNPEIARQALGAAEPEMARGVRKGVVHRNAAARKMSRLARRIKAIAPRREGAA
ncbi:MAG TPA: 30S ribosomal protein S20 [Alphaproteobacteria bacterium]|nr:30S ribosomal protein S20 [Alphaproteobacteria bacterium]